jgi:phosphatidylglycerophosphate synthase
LAAALGGVFVTYPIARHLHPAGVLPALTLYGLVVVVASWLLFRSYPHARLGFANIITLIRAMLICALAAPLAHWGLLEADPQRAWVVVAIASVALCLDGIDGYLARRQNVVSRFGAGFDVEIDSILALSLAILLFQNEKAGLWVLGLGVIRYLFVFAGYLLPWLRADLPPRFSRKLVCVIQIATLVLLVSPLVAPPSSVVIAALATAMLVWSFAVDVVWLAHNRR